MEREGFLQIKQIDRLGTYVLFAGITCLLIISFVDPAFAQYDESKFGVICNRAVSYVESGFGTLVAAVAGMGAIVASAAGGFRTAWACLVVSIGSFILRNYLDLFFQGLCN